VVQKGLPWPLGAFENRRSFTSIENLIFIVSQLIENDIESGIYQVADDEALSTNELIRLNSFSTKTESKNMEYTPKIDFAFSKGRRCSSFTLKQ